MADGDVQATLDGSGLEYYLKYPSPSAEQAGAGQPSSLTNSSVVDDFVLVHNEARPPVVVLLGWAGCQDKHLAKYSSIYSEKGCITLRCTAPLGCLFLRRSKMRAMGRQLLDELMGLNLNEHPVFFHVFSNGGAYFYKHVALAMQERVAPIKVHGVIWDSAPGQRRIVSTYLALKVILESRWPWMAPPCLPTWVPDWLNNFLDPLCASEVFSAWLALWLTLWWLLEVLVQAVLSMRAQPLDPLAELDNVPTAYTGSHLFLYSPTDRLIKAKDVERFAGHRRGLGELVTAVRFAKSAHVQHYLAHKEVYTEAIYSFMRDVLSGRRPSPTQGDPSEE